MIITNKTKFLDNDGISYKIIESLGNGAFGYVYKIIRDKDKKVFALKTIPSEFIDENIQKAFSNESKIALEIKDKNVIEYYYIHDGKKFENLSPYIIMEFADGGTLQKYIESYKQEKKFIENELLIKLINDLIHGMQAINSKLIHRDIKPDNILICNDIIKISDFGLSKIVLDQTRTSTFKGFGHIKYMPPEGWKFEKNTIQMDIYSMGIVLYQLATLQHPYKVTNESDPMLWKEAHMFQTPVNPLTINQNLTPIVGQTILKMLQKNINSRFKSWEEIKTSFDTDELPKTQFTSIIQNVLQKRLVIDTKESESRLSQEKKENDTKELHKLINYQFKEIIYDPIKSFIEEFNLNYKNGSISISDFEVTSNNRINVNITLLNRKQIVIEFRCLSENDYSSERTVQGFRGNVIQESIEDIPKIYNEKIIGWGKINLVDGIGLNIILTENENEIHGKWYTLTNKNNPMFVNQRLPEPFPFEFDEIKKEIKYFGAMHIYTTIISKYDESEVIGLISKLI